MMDSDYESKLDEMERSSLQKAISDVETALAASTPGTRPLFEGFLQNAKGRVATLDKKIKESQAQRESHAQEQATIAYLAQKEAALSASEKETYSGFLEKPFFTNKDFGSLESFYAHTWDRLSEGGKDQMSRRIWEGIRRDEYKFSELPETVREKETERAYNVLQNSSIELKSAVQVPEKDRQDFLRAYEGGNQQEASKILDRESFRKSMFLGKESTSVEHARVDIGRDAEGQNLGTKIKAGPATAENPDKTGKGLEKAKLDVTDLNLDGLKLAEAPKTPSPASIPRGDAGQVKDSASLGSG